MEMQNTLAVNAIKSSWIRCVQDSLLMLLTFALKLRDRRQSLFFYYITRSQNTSKR